MNTACLYLSLLFASGVLLLETLYSTLPHVLCMQACFTKQQWKKLLKLMLHSMDSALKRTRSECIQKAVWPTSASYLCSRLPPGLFPHEESHNNKSVYGYLLPNLSPSSNLYKVQSVYNTCSFAILQEGLNASWLMQLVTTASS